MKKKNRPELRTSQVARIFKDMLDLRRIYCKDSEFFRMDEFWDWLSDEDGDSVGIQIKRYKSSNLDPYKNRAATIAFGDNATLVVPEDMMVKAAEGCKLSNYTLAHEIGHLALGHHARSAVVKNFQLFSSDNGLANIPPTVEELEANYAAVFFQCGIALLDPKIDPLELANRASTDVYSVRKIKKLCGLDVFQRELIILSASIERVVL